PESAPEQSRLWKLTLRPKRRQPDTRQARYPLVQQVARLPAREELRVEAVKPLDLEEGIGEQQAAAGQALHPPARLVQEAGKRGEVQPHLFDASLPEQLDASSHEELHQAVRRVVVPPHRGQRDRRAPVAGCEVEKAADA